jgi:hypothetical protein
MAAVGWNEKILAADSFPVFTKSQIAYTIPTNTVGCYMDPTNVVGTNYLYKLDGQVFGGSVEGHIQTFTEGFSGKTDEGTPWKTLTELFAAYQKGSLESDIRPIYSEKTSSDFLRKMYGDKETEARMQAECSAFSSMEVLMGFDYSDGYLAIIKVGYKDGHYNIMPYYFVLEGSHYKVSQIVLRKMNPMLINIFRFQINELSAVQR